MICHTNVFESIKEIIEKTDEEDNADSVDGDANNEDDGNDGQANFTILAVEPYIYEDENLFLGIVFPWILCASTNIF